MFQVVVVVCAGATAVVMVVIPFVSKLIIPIDIVSIDIDIYDVEYNDGDSHFYGKPQKAFGSDSCLADHAESPEFDCPLCSSADHRGQSGRLRPSSPRRTAAQ